ncbi:MAG: 5-(carboxyamino)imidazole ribonucleotide mutase [Dehalococcoidia bacterium]|nr:5-(carboxyamino)imidazole ribonucleotide mutase [Dehalococcoidia bacterium]MDW8119060.1 5-(carboxyamino)imidazole ribonucleotide mutase [Chloroflexota bacterium]
MPLVSVVMGSRSDEPTLQETVKVLDELGISYEVHVLSAHRTPDKLREMVVTAPQRGVEVFIAAAGGSAALPGTVAAHTTLPVIGVPLPSSPLQGIDALLAIAQMPPGVPVACVAIGSWGARNAAYLAAAILALKHDTIRQAYQAYRERLRQ